MRVVQRGWAVFKRSKNLTGEKGAEVVSVVQEPGGGAEDR